MVSSLDWYLQHVHAALTAVDHPPPKLVCTHGRTWHMRLPGEQVSTTPDGPLGALVILSLLAPAGVFTLLGPCTCASVRENTASLS